MAYNVLDSDRLRGHIETFVLSALMDGSKYGGEIKRVISERTKSLYEPNEQSLYSAYHRLEDIGCIKGSWGDESFGATRKYYTITEEGKRLYEENKAKWQTAKKMIDLLIG